MKKSIFALGLMFVALTLTNCTKNEEENIVPEIKGQKFELFAVPDTRTTIDGLDTSWTANDELNVFHADAGTTTYTKDNKFSIAEADVTSGRFTGTLAGTLEEGKNYDWYVSYPYNANIKSPNATQGWMTVGSAHNVSQSQTGNSSMAHICGDKYPLCAKVLNVAAADKVVFDKMNHLTSVVKVKVTNTESEAITVNKVSFATSSNDIVGTYKINFTGDDVAYTASGASYVSKTASLDVVGGTPIEQNANAEFYIGIKPFTAAVGETLTITVSTDKGDCVKTLELTKATTFTAGNIKTLNFGFVAPNDLLMYWDLSKDQTSTATSDEIAWSSDIVNMQVAKGSSTTNCNNYYPGTIGESYTSTRFYKNSILTITPNAGYTISRIVFEATTDNYAKILPAAEWTNATCEYLGKIVTITPANGDNEISTKVYGTCGFNKVTIYYSVDPAKIQPTLILTPDDSAIELAADDVAQHTISVKSNTENINVSSDSDWLTVGYANGIITYQVTGTSEIGRTANITVSATNDNGETKKVISVTQKSLKLDAPTITSVSGTVDAITASWNKVEHATAYAWELYKGTDKETGTLVQNGTYTPDDLTAATVTLTIEGTFTAGEQYVLYVKSTADAPFVESAPAKSEPFEIKEAGAEPELVTYYVDFENTADTYTDWTFNNFTSQQTGNIKSNGGTYYGTTGGKASGYLQFNSLLAKPKSLTFFISKQSNNTTSSNWKIQQSTNGSSSWTDLKSQSATSMSKGEWQEISIDLSGYNNIYIRIYYTGSTAVRNIDDVTLIVEK